MGLVTLRSLQGTVSCLVFNARGGGGGGTKATRAPYFFLQLFWFVHNVAQQKPRVFTKQLSFFTLGHLVVNSAKHISSCSICNRPKHIRKNMSWHPHHSKFLLAPRFFNSTDGAIAKATLPVKHLGKPIVAFRLSPTNDSRHQDTTELFSDCFL